MVKARRRDPIRGKIHVRLTVIVNHVRVRMGTCHNRAATVIAFSIFCRSNPTVPCHAIGDCDTGNIERTHQSAVSGIAHIGNSAGSKTMIDASAATSETAGRPPGAHQTAIKLISGHRTGGITVDNLDLSALNAAYQATEMPSGGTSGHRSRRMAPKDGHRVVGRNLSDKPPGIVSPARYRNILSRAIRDAERGVTGNVGQQAAHIGSGSSSRNCRIDNVAVPELASLTDTGSKSSYIRSSGSHG